MIFLGFSFKTTCCWNGLVKKLHSSDAKTIMQLMGNAIASNANVPKFRNIAKIRALISCDSPIRSKNFELKMKKIPTRVMAADLVAVASPTALIQLPEYPSLGIATVAWWLSSRLELAVALAQHEDRQQQQSWIARSLLHLRFARLEKGRLAPEARYYLHK